MLRRPTQILIKIYNQTSKSNIPGNPIHRALVPFSTIADLSEFPRTNQKSERKPLVTGITELKRRSRLKRRERQEVHEIVLKPPENGLLVKSLIPLAHQVFDARTELYACVSKVMECTPVHVCRVCGEVQVGEFPHKIRTCDGVGSLPTKEHSWVGGGIEHVLPVVNSFHLYDRLGRAVSHEEQLQVDRISAIVELCVQAGVDIPEYPAKRRLFPVYNIAGKMIDFERKFPRDYSSGKDIQPYGFWEKKKLPGSCNSLSFSSSGNIQDTAELGMKAWEKIRTGAMKLMEKYPAQTCGYCSEVQVGPKGHRARICQAYKHQMRDGQHAWQEATIDDLMPPVHVWHVQDPHSREPLSNELERYYGKLPAAVELFAQAGASVGEVYARSMKKDVAVPRLDEEKLVV